MTDASSDASRPRLSREEAESLAMPIWRAQVISFVLIVPFAALSVLPHGVLWGIPDENPLPLSVLVAFVGSIVIHEALHGLGYYWAGAERSEIEFGFSWMGLAPYAHCAAPLRANPYRVAIALPGLVLGVLPLAAGLGLGLWWLTLYAFFMLVAAAGDTLLLWFMRGVPADTWTQDHPSEVGCLVLGHSASPVAPILEDDVEDATDNSEEQVSLRTLGLIIGIALILGFVFGFFFYS
jgi:hypothetical protein